MTTTTNRARRRTFKEVAIEAYGRGWSEGREASRKEFEEGWKLLSKHDSDTMAELLRVQSQLDNISLRRLAWSRITGLFRRDRHD
jgi:hypothetical protein